MGFLPASSTTLRQAQIDPTLATDVRDHTETTRQRDFTAPTQARRAWLGENAWMRSPRARFLEVLG